MHRYLHSRPVDARAAGSTGFPNAYSADGTTAEDIVTANAAGNYAEPGVYTMFVQYVLLEDQ